MSRKKIHASSIVHTTCVFVVGSKHTDTVLIGKHCVVQEYVVIKTCGGKIVIGNNCSINPFCVLYGHNGLIIGNNVRIAAHTVLIPANHVFSRVDIPICKQGTSGTGIKICNDVWIGANCSILDGVTVGEGSVIGAGSVVTRSIPQYSVAVGSPARVIRSRKK